MADHRLPVDRCPYCGHEHDAVSNAPGEEGGPAPGDTSICIQCAGILKFDNSLRLRKATDEERYEAMLDPTVRNIWRAVKITNARRS